MFGLVFKMFEQVELVQLSCLGLERKVEKTVQFYVNCNYRGGCEGGEGSGGAAERRPHCSYNFLRGEKEEQALISSLW